MELWSATSADPPAPDARIATLTHTTGAWTPGKNTFNAPTVNTTLKAETTYFVFLSYSGSASDGIDLAVTRSRVPDRDSALGWNPGQVFSRTRTPQGGWSDPTGTPLAQFAILGSFVLNPDPPGQNVSEPDGDDFPANDRTTGRVAVGGSVTGNIDDANDKDAFEVHLEIGPTYQIDVEGADTGQGTLENPRLVGLRYVDEYDPDGYSVHSEDKR